MENQKKELKVKLNLGGSKIKFFENEYNEYKVFLNLDESRIKFFENEYNKLKELEKNKDRVYIKIIDLFKRGCLYHANQVIECNYNHRMIYYIYYFQEYDLFNTGNREVCPGFENQEVLYINCSGDQIREKINFKQFKENLRYLMVEEIEGNIIKFYIGETGDFPYKEELSQFVKEADLSELKKLTFEYTDLKDKFEVAKNELEEEEGYKDFMSLAFLLGRQHLE